MNHLLEIPGRLPGLNEYTDANRRSPYEGAKLKVHAQDQILLAIRKQLKGVRITQPVWLEYHWIEPSRRRDKDNISSAAKYVQDALVKAGVLHNDGWHNVIGATHKFNVTESGYHAISGEYMHDFNNAYHGRRNPGANNYGIDFKDAVSLGYEVKYNKLTVMANAVAAFEQQDGNGTNNVGLELQPTYSVHPNVDLVFRYNGMTGKGACKLGADRYICTQTTSPSWVDSLHAFYIGTNVYASAKHKDAARIMFGAEYTTARKNGTDCYNGWEFTTALRTNF